MDDASEDVESDLIDLSEIDLAGLAELDNPVLARALKSIREEAGQPDGVVAGFQSSI